jgi:hypothetical protein
MASQGDNLDRAHETPLRLGVAAAHFGLTAGALRAEARRGRLEIWRVAGKDWTSLAEVERMFRQCRVNPEAPGFGFGPAASASAMGPSSKASGSSETEAVTSALDAARALAQKLKNSSPPISRPSTSPPGESASLVKFPSRT